MTREKLPKLRMMLLVLAMMFVMIPMTVNALDGGGTTDAPYTVGTFDDLKEAVNNGGYIRLTKDITLTETLVFPAGKTVDIDLNSYTLTGENDKNKRIEIADGAELTVRNGNIVSATNFTPIPGEKVPGAVLIKNEGDLTIADKAVITSDINVLWANKGKLTVEDGAWIQSEHAAAILTNGTSTLTAEINIKGGLIASLNDIAIYAPAGTFNVSGGTITGATTVYVKAGAFNITGGTFSANGEKLDVKEYNDGAYPTGDAIVVEAADPPYNGSPGLFISGSPRIISQNAACIQVHLRAGNQEPKVTSTTTDFELADGKYWIKDGNVYAVTGDTRKISRDKVAELEAYANEQKQIAYNDQVEIAILNAKLNIVNCDTPDEMDVALNSGKISVDAAVTKALLDAKNEAVKQIDSVKEDDYIEADQGKVTDAKNDAKLSIDRVSKTSDIPRILVDFNLAIADCTTKEQQKEANLKALQQARENAIEDLRAYFDSKVNSILPSDKMAAELAVLNSIDKIRDADSKDAIDVAVKSAKAEIDRFVDKKAKQDAAIAVATAQKVAGFKVKAQKKAMAKITWKKNNAVTSYEIYRATKSNGKYTKIATLNKTKVKYVNKKLKKYKKYYYKMRTYTVVDGKAYYGKWTSVKKIKAKK